MQIFLSGQPGVGKSTVVRRVLALLGGTYGGFCTGFAPDGVSLCLWPAGGDPDFREETTVARRAGDGLMAVPHGFDQVGTPILNLSDGLVVMDELGWIEGNDHRFQRAVLDILDSGCPVLGVIKPRRQGTWLMDVECRKDVVILNVTCENRDELPQKVATMLAGGR